MARPTNQQFALAVHVLTILAARPEEVQSSEVLASSAGSNAVHVRRVLSHLRVAGLVVSRPGPGGGWQPSPDGHRTTLGDVWRAVQGSDPVLGLHDASADCDVGQRIQSALESIERSAAQAIEAELDRTTLCDLARETRAESLGSAT
jgi:Rrf2 family protein